MEYFLNIYNQYSLSYKCWNFCANWLIWLQVIKENKWGFFSEHSVILPLKWHTLLSSLTQQTTKLYGIICHQYDAHSNYYKNSTSRIQNRTWPESWPLFKILEWVKLGTSYLVICTQNIARIINNWQMEHHQSHMTPS